MVFVATKEYRYLLAGIGGGAVSALAACLLFRRNDNGYGEGNRHNHKLFDSLFIRQPGQDDEAYYRIIQICHHLIDGVLCI